MAFKRMVTIVVIVFITACVLTILNSTLNRVSDLEKKTEFYQLEEVHGLYENGGSLVEDKWVPRSLSTIVSNTEPGQGNVSIKNNSFTVGKGKWSVACWSTVVATDKAVLRLFNVTQDRVEACGQVLYHGTQFGCRLRLDTVIDVEPGNEDTGTYNEYQLQVKATKTWDVTGKGMALQTQNNASETEEHEDAGNVFVLSCVRVQRIGN